ncbi:MAG TPA: hypothetical protein PKX07_19525, partial [Aggregatilineales bacterium]|nr:hypothetical protein [Aggregatilineales bacterium]
CGKRSLLIMAVPVQVKDRGEPAPQPVGMLVVVRVVMAMRVLVVMWVVMAVCMLRVVRLPFHRC